MHLIFSKIKVPEHFPIKTQQPTPKDPAIPSIFRSGAKKEKQKIRNIIQACFFLENQEKQDLPRKSLRTMEKNIYIEELRQERI